MTWIIGILAVTIAALAVWRNRHIWEEVNEESRDAVRDAKADLHRREWERKNPEGPPLSETEHAALIDWFDGLAKAALLLKPNPALGSAAPATLGGPVWLTQDERWPISKNGQAMEFIAQLDFAGLPALAGFPNEGVARFFISRGDTLGANWDQPAQSDIAVLWHEGPLVGGRWAPQPLLPEGEWSPFTDLRVRDHGVPLEAVPISDRHDASCWEIEAKLEGMARRAGFSELQDELWELSEKRVYAHRVGGHPTFTQYDFRKPGHYDDFTVNLLGLTSDDALLWGDVGEAVFMMRPDDLERRDFRQVAFSWDCH